MKLLTKTLTLIATLSCMTASVQAQAAKNVWHVKAIHPDGTELIAIKAIGKKGELHPVKALYDEKSHVLDIKVLNADGTVMHHVKAIDEKHSKHHGIKAVSDTGEILSIKAITKSGKKYDVKAVISKSNTMSIKVVTPKGEYWPIKAISPAGQIFDVKAIDFGATKHIHVKAVPHSHSIGN